MLKNWESKKRFLDKEIQRYKTYADALQQQEEEDEQVDDRQSQQQQQEKTHIEQRTPPFSSSWSVKLDFNDSLWSVGTDLLKEINEELKLSDNGSLLTT